MGSGWTDLADAETRPGHQNLLLILAGVRMRDVIVKPRPEDVGNGFGQIASPSLVSVIGIVSDHLEV